jgi:hypothetical protein
VSINLIIVSWIRCAHKLFMKHCLMMFARYMNDPEFQKLVAESLGAEVYQRLTGHQLSMLEYKVQSTGKKSSRT